MDKPPPLTIAPIAAILGQHRKLILDIASRMDVPPADRDEILQRVALSLLSNPGNIPRAGDLRPWLRAVTRHRIAEYFAEYPARLERFPPAARERLPSPLTPEERLLVRQTRNIVRAGIRRLSRPRRLVWLLHEFRGLTLQRIADRLRVPLGTVATHHYRARQSLTDWLLRRAAAEDKEPGGRSFAVFPFWLLWRSFTEAPGGEAPGDEVPGDEGGTRGHGVSTGPRALLQSSIPLQSGALLQSSTPLQSGALLQSSTPLQSSALLQSSTPLQSSAPPRRAAPDPRAPRPLFPLSLAATFLFCALLPWHTWPRLLLGDLGHVEAHLMGDTSLPVAGTASHKEAWPLALAAQSDPRRSDMALARPPLTATAPLTASAPPPLTATPPPTGPASPTATAAPPTAPASPLPRTAHSPARAASPSWPHPARTPAPNTAAAPARHERDLIIPRTWLARAQRAIIEGDLDLARRALRGYDDVAPDDPFPDTRRNIARALQGGRR